VKDADKNHALFSNTRTMARHVFRGFQNISTFRPGFGNPLEKAPVFAVSALFFQIISTCGIVFGNLLEKLSKQLLWRQISNIFPNPICFLEILWKKHPSSQFLPCFSR